LSTDVITKKKQVVSSKTKKNAKTQTSVSNKPSTPATKPSTPATRTSPRRSGPVGFDVSLEGVETFSRTDTSTKKNQEISSKTQGSDAGKTQTAVLKKASGKTQTAVSKKASREVAGVSSSRLKSVGIDSSVERTDTYLSECEQSSEGTASPSYTRGAENTGLSGRSTKATSSARKKKTGQATKTSLLISGTDALLHKTVAFDVTSDVGKEIVSQLRCTVSRSTLTSNHLIGTVTRRAPQRGSAGQLVYEISWNHSQ